MKSHHDPRHLRRIRNMQSLFAYGNSQTPPETTDAQDIIKHLSAIDLKIVQIAPKWPIDKMNQVDLAILRCAVWEILYQPNTPVKVVIDEAVEIAKEFGTETSSSFINGCLGSLINQHDPN